MRIGLMGLILLLFAIRYIPKRQRLTALAAADFPNVAAERFEEWRRMELRSIDVLLWVAGVLLVLGLVGSGIINMVEAAGRGPTPGLVIGVGALFGVNLLTFFGGLTVSAVHGSRAARLRKSLGINWR
jgi:hypothetical protein